MITARNYAAQAEKYLSQLIDAAFKFNDIDQREIDAYDFLRKSISESVKFALPDEGRIFNDDLRGIKNEEICLPYDSLTVEFFSQRLKAKCLVMAHQVDLSANDIAPASSAWEVISRTTEAPRHIIYIYILIDNCRGYGWMLIPYCYATTSLWSKTCVDGKPAWVCELIAPSYAKYALGLDKEKTESLGFKGRGYATSVLELCEALTCTNVEPIIHQPANPKTNAKRIKQGKLPIYETKVLALKPTVEDRHGIGRGPLGHERNGPRQHLRRGHIRRLPTGKNTWVQSCVVGSLKDGLISKSYEVRA